MLRKRNKKTDAIEAVPKWAIAPGGVGHALTALKPVATAICGKTGFRGGAFVSFTPKRICQDCATILGTKEHFADPRPTPPTETQHSLFD